MISNVSPAFRIIQFLLSFNVHFVIFAFWLYGRVKRSIRHTSPGQFKRQNLHPNWWKNNIFTITPHNCSIFFSIYWLSNSYAHKSKTIPRPLKYPHRVGHSLSFLGISFFFPLSLYPFFIYGLHHVEITWMTFHFQVLANNFSYLPTSKCWTFNRAKKIFAPFFSLCLREQHPQKRVELSTLIFS